MFLATVASALTGFKTVKSIVEKQTWIPWALLTGVLVFAAAYMFFGVFCWGNYT